MLESQKLVGSGPVQPVRWLRLCFRVISPQRTNASAEVIEFARDSKSNQAVLYYWMVYTTFSITGIFMYLYLFRDSLEASYH